MTPKTQEAKEKKNDKVDFIKIVTLVQQRTLQSGKGMQHDVATGQAVWLFMKK